jgi:hypothetical protein
MGRMTDLLSIVDESRNNTEEFIVRREDGMAFAVQVSVSIVTSASDECIGRMASFVNITKHKMLETDLERKLQEALDQINILSGILRICASCKRIRDEKGGWKQIEYYIREHSEADFSHGICPECANKFYSEFKK